VIRYDNTFYAYSEWVEQAGLRKGGRKEERRELIALNIHTWSLTQHTIALLHCNELRPFSVPELLITNSPSKRSVASK